MKEDIDKAINKMNEAIEDKEVIYPKGVKNSLLIPLTDKEKKESAIDHKKLDQSKAERTVEEIIDSKPIEEALIEPFSRKHTTGKKLIDERMRSILLRLAEKYFFYDAICAKAGIYRQRLNEELRKNEDFGHSFAYARHRFIAHHQDLLLQYARDKREKDWRAEKYILTIADKEYSERKYLTEAVANQDAKILMLIKAEQLTIASKKGKEMLKTVINTPSQGEESISLLPFKPEDPKNKGKAKNVKNKG